jgi:tyrocidine synthetase-3
MVKTLQEMLIRAAASQKGIYVISSDKDTFVSYRELLQKSLGLLNEFQNAKLRPRQEVVVFMESPIDFLYIIWACFMGNMIPVPLTASTNPEHLNKLAKVCSVMDNPCIVTDLEDTAIITSALPQEASDCLLSYNSLADWKQEGVICSAEEHEVAIVQFSSGSTGDPKGVMLTHCNLLTNIRAILSGMKHEQNHKQLNWMPFTHDMGLIGGHLTSVEACSDQYQMATSLFVRRPALWIKKLSEYDIHYTSSPNFGYGYFLDFVKDSDLNGINLSSVRLIFNGAEPISASLCERFMERLRPYGLRPDVWFPVYGMAEASLAVTFPNVGDGLQTVSVDRNSLTKGEQVRVIPLASRNSARFVVEGYPVSDCNIRICDDTDNSVPAHVVGHIQICGANVTKGYYNNPEATASAYTDDYWLRTGDLGFIYEGRLVVTGREKDILFVHGQNVYPADIESLGEQVEGIKPGRLVACGVPNDRAEDELILFLYAPKKDWEIFVPLALKLKQTIKEQAGLNVMEVVPIRRIPKTTSGKVQRYQLVSNYRAGKFDEVVQELQEHYQLHEQLSRGPQTELEHKLLLLVEELLGEGITVTQSFRDAGLDSLKTAYLSAVIAERLNMKVLASTLLKIDTVEELAAFLETTEVQTDKPADLPKSHDISTIVPALPHQRRLYVLEQLEGAVTSNHVTFAIRLSPRYCKDKINAALHEMARCHESLRTTFAVAEFELVQHVHDHVSVEAEEIDPKGSLEDAVIAWMRPFNLAAAPLWRVGLYDDPLEQRLIVFDFHHIIIDGSSVMLLIRDFFQLLDGGTIIQPVAQYRDMANWYSSQLVTGGLAAQEKYWLNQFDGEIPVLELPTDKPRFASNGFRGAAVSFVADEELTTQLKKLGSETDSTFSVILLAAYYTLLAAYTGQSEIVIGTPFANRLHPDFNNTVGMFVNTLALRIKANPDGNFKELLADVNEVVNGALDHQAYFCEDLVSKLGIQPDLNRNALYDVVFNMQNMFRPRTLDKIAIKTVELPRKTAKVDLTLECMEREGSLFFIFEYNTDLFLHETIERMAAHYLQILRTVAANINQNLNQIDMIDDKENRLLDHFRTTYSANSTGRPFLALFGEQAQSYPWREALFLEGDSITYGQLDAMSDKLADDLLRKGIGSEKVVGVMASSGLGQFVALLGIMKSGGACLPIDPTYPKERVVYMLSDCKPSILITDHFWNGSLTFEGEFIDLFDYTDVSTLDDGELRSTVSAVHSPEDLSIVLYTSGTTGKPKGIMLEHGNLTAYLDAFQREFGLHSGDVVLQQASFAFDNFIEEVLPALATGASLVVMKKEDVLNPELLQKKLHDKQVSVISCSSLLVNEINKLTLPASLRLVISGGDVLKPEYISSLSKHCAVYNTYGPTETTVCATYYRYSEDSDRISIGKPIAHYRIYIVDKHGRPTPIGIPGQLCIAGSGVARGYCGSQELTKERFKTDLIQGERVYLTGDLAKWLPDGNLAFLGRVDRQVKLRGYRIELNEVEQALKQCQSIIDAIIVPIDEGTGGTSICAYMITERPMSAAELRSEMAKRIPDYAIPPYFIEVDRFPMTTQGKLDVKRLPSPQLTIKLGHTYEAPQDNIEEKLEELWCELLGQPRVGMMDHFFTIGGHSLKAAILASRIRKEFGSTLSIRDIFANPTIRQLGEQIRASMVDSVLTRIPVSDRTLQEMPASPAQSRMYVLHQMDQSSTVYNISRAMLIEGELDEEHFASSLNQLVERHESLRTSFTFKEGEVIQRIHDPLSIAFFVEELEEDQLLGRIDAHIRPFDLSVPGLLRVVQFRIHKQRSVLLLDMHHIISDAASIAILLKDFKHYYAANETLPASRLQYRDFSSWHRSLLESDRMTDFEKFWLDQFNCLPQALELPTDYQRPAVQRHRGDTISFKVDEQLALQLKACAIQTGSTLYMVLLAAFSVLLAKYTGQDDIVVGSPVSGRTDADLEEVVGMFVNTLPIRTCPNQHMSFSAFLCEVRTKVLHALEAQDYPFERLVERLKLPRDTNRNPLFDTVFVMQNTAMPTLQTEKLQMQSYPIQLRTAMFDIALECVESGGVLNFLLEYNTDIFQCETMKRMAVHFVNILTQVSSDITTTLGNIELLSDDEKSLLEEWSTGDKVTVPAATIPYLFVSQAKKTPNQAAVILDDRSYTYKDLDRLSDALAHELRLAGVGRESIVGVCMERRPEQIAALMAVWKAGGAYLPIDPDYPAARVEYILRDSRPTLLFTDRELEVSLPHGLMVWNIENLVESLPLVEVTPVELINQPEDLAYVIYTSGTTGNPKGVMVEHSNVSAYVYAFQAEFALTGEDKVLQQASFAFDAFVEEVYPALTTGATVVMAKKEELQRPKALAEKLASSNVSVISCSPLLLNELNKQLIPSSMRLVISGGDVLHETYVTNLIQQCLVYNTYGPTETTVCASYYRLRGGEERTPIGKPITNYNIYILDSSNRQVPIGVAGQLCVGGVGITRGYLGRSDLTLERYACDLVREGERIYRTGDLARWLPDGQLEYLGREDRQVNIRGYRIETTEIEAVLSRHDAVAESAVIALPDEDGSLYLCAYIVCRLPWNTADIRTFLSAHVPSFMIPSYLVEIDRLPVTTNGKLDVRSLPNPKTEMIKGKEKMPPRNERDASLIELWKEVLGFPSVGIEDDFFELGGHSLKALELVNQIEQSLNLVIPVSTVFMKSRLQDLSDSLCSAVASAPSQIRAVPPADSYAMSSSQKRLYLIDQVEGPTTAYNMPAVFRIRGSLSLPRLHAAWCELIGRHESLRSSFTTIGGEPRMIVHDNVQPVFNIEQPAVCVSTEADLQVFMKPFDLSHVPLCRLHAIPENDGCFLVFIDMHHIISDAATIEILFEELEALYQGTSLHPVSIEYKDYAAWQQATQRDERMQVQVQYWLQRLAGELPVMQFPCDHSKELGAHLSESRLFVLEVSQDLSSAIQKVAARLRVTPYMVLFAIYNVLLSKYTSQEDLIVGIPVIGRARVELEGVVGMFVNSLAIRSFPKSGITFNDYVQEIKEAVTGAFQNQDIPLELLVDQLNTQRNQRDVTLSSLFKTMFSYREEPAQRMFAGCPVENIPISNRMSKFDLAMEAVHDSSGYRLELTYAADLFLNETMEAFGRQFLHLLQTVLEEPMLTLSSFAVMSRKEALSQLSAFNPIEINLNVKPIFEEISRQALLTPYRTAAECGEDTISYYELNGLANTLALQLSNRGIGRGCYVPVWMDRSIELIVSILAVMKTGAAFVPMDPNWPTGRVISILEDTMAAWILTNGRDERTLPSELIKPITLPVVLSELVPIDYNIEQAVNLEDPIYVIYTSGSTGKPKGVMVPHLGIANRFAWMNSYFGDKASRSVLQTTHHVFDSAVWQLFWPLTRGGKTVLPDAERLLSAEYIASTIQKHEVTLIDFVPSVFNIIVDQLMRGSTRTLQQLDSLTSVIVGGEEVTVSSVHKFQQLLPYVQLTNLYGPTEASIGCIYHQINGDEKQRIPIGKPIDNTQIMILDENRQLVPPGVPGEIYISGLCLSTGYLNDLAKTEAAFLPHAYPETGWSRMYKTGDLARYSHNGVIEYLGRCDFQVKIRGLRIELGEIESQILHTGLVKEVVVTAPTINQQTMLCAYVIADEQHVDTDKLKAFLAATMPNFMVPSIFMQLPSMPLSASGKVDRKALPKPELNDFAKKVAPEVESEGQLLQVWREVLGFEDFGVTDDFFLLGGHSIKLFALAARIQNQFGLSIALKDLFRMTTIRQQAKYILEQQLNEGSLPKVEYPPYPENTTSLVVSASASQKALFVIDKLEGVGTSYNMPQLFEWVGPFNEFRFRQTIELLVERHEALRTRFEMINGEVVQIVERSCLVDIIEFDCHTGLDSAMAAFVQPFDLSRSPLYRVGLLQSDQRIFIFMDMHHIISDGRSLNVLIEDFHRSYMGQELPALLAQYRHFGTWQKQFLASEAGRKHEAYWMQYFEQMATPLQLQADFDKPTIQSFEGETILYEFGAAFSACIRELAVRNNCTLYMVMLACYSILLAHYSGQDDIVVGTPVSGRTQLEFEHTVGMFVNTVPFRTRLDMSMAFADYLRQVRENTLETLEHQNYPLEELVRRLPAERGGSGAVLFRTLLALENDEGMEASKFLRPVELAGWQDQTVKFDVVLTIRDSAEQIRASVQYAKHLFAKETASSVIEHLRMLLEQVLEDETIPISAINLISMTDHRETAVELLEEPSFEFDF